MSLSPAPEGVVARVARATARTCELLAVLAILSLFFVVAFNVLARAVFDASGTSINLMIPGAIELASYMLLIAVFAALPAGIERGLIRVDVLMVLMPGGLERLLTRFWFLVLLVLALTLAWLFADQVGVSYAQGEVTQDLRVPMWILHLVVTLECAAFAIVSLAEVINPVVSHDPGAGELS